MYILLAPPKKEPPKLDNFEHAKQIQHKNHGSDKVSGSICILYLERSFYKKSSPRITSSMGNQCKFWSHVINKITTQSLTAFAFKLWLLPSLILNLLLNLCFILQSSSLNPTKLFRSRKVTSNPLQNPYSISDGLPWSFRNGQTEQCPSLSWHRAWTEVRD